ncbi:nickel-dependent hydrogenase large subunit [Methanorbis furvi]|uniref:Formate hydrogenlyase subunit 5 n=1 Tax=Methanorbis furvi TaxID=3028299 RepID=A0AAE4SA08_9EURY|nr:Formate hydrogenlyase subunit 5 [Methanocorpusculaceae archaeon Ag1]
MKKVVDISLPIGPVHPCFKEPARIKCETIGERVIATEVELGYVKKGIEKIMIGRPWQETIFLAERVCGICSVVHNTVIVGALESISGIAVSPRAAHLRIILNELDRMQSHLLANYSYCYTIEHETLAMYLLNLRETVMDAIEIMTGTRIMAAYVVPGGVREDITDETAEKIREAIAHVEAELPRFVKMFATGPMIALRSKGIGILSEKDAKESGVVGPTARASGIPRDARANDPLYKELGWKMITRPEGDNFARIMLRFDELFQSTTIIKNALAALPQGPIRLGGRVTAGRCKHTIEAPRGDLTYDIELDAEGQVISVAIQTPSIMNVEVGTHAMMKNLASAADVTSTFISADPCIACAER